MADFFSKIDSDRFGIKVARLDNIKDDYEISVENLKSEGAKLIIARIPLVNIQLVNKLENIGFRLKDVQNIYHYPMYGQMINLECVFNNKVQIVNYAPEHKQQIIEITKEAFDGYGHYFADDRLSSENCLAVYTDWAEKCCEDNTLCDVIFVAKINDIVVSYSCFKCEMDEKGRYASAVIGAVSKKYRESGVFKMIIAKGIEWGLKNNLEWFSYNVLTYNYAINNLLIKLNAKIVDTSATFHLWLDEV